MISKIEIFKKSIAAGVMICIGAVIKISCDNEIIGSMLFAVGLFFCCSLDMCLFTGKIGYVNKSNKYDYPIIWLGNLIGCVVYAILIRIANPLIQEKSEKLMIHKYEMNIIQLSILAFFCGILMYLIVDNFKKSNIGTIKLFGIIIGVMTFILSGYEHSIANMAYSALYVSDINSMLNCLTIILICTFFNSLGSISIKYLQK